MALSPRAIAAMKEHAARGGTEGDIAARKLAAMGIPVGGGGSPGAARIAGGGGGGGGGANITRHYPKPGNRVALPAGGGSGAARPPMKALPPGRPPMKALPSGGVTTPVSIRSKSTPIKMGATRNKKVVEEAIEQIPSNVGNAGKKAIKQKSIFKGHGKGLLIGAGAAVVAGLAMNRRGSGTSSGKAGMTRY